MVTIIVFRTSSSSTKESSSLVWQFKHDNNVCESYIASYHELENGILEITVQLLVIITLRLLVVRI